MCDGVGPEDPSDLVGPGADQQYRIRRGVQEMLVEAVAIPCREFMFDQAGEMPEQVQLADTEAARPPIDQADRADGSAAWRADGPARVEADIWGPGHQGIVKESPFTVLIGGSRRNLKHGRCRA